jgi:hypothetical protein
LDSIWDENNLKPLTSNNERTSLVPAPAVILALRVYLDVAAVKTLIANSTGKKFKCFNHASEREVRSDCKRNL